MNALGRDIRVVITGLGAVTPIGLGVAEFRKSLYAGRSGVGPISHFDCSSRDPRTGESQFSTRIAAEVKGFSAEAFLNKPKRYDRASQFAMAAARMAMKEAGIDSNDHNRSRIGLVIGTGMGDMCTLEWGASMLRRGFARRIPPTALPKVIPCFLVGNLASLLGLGGVTLSVSTACASSSHAVGEAYWLIRRGDADVVIAGGAEAPITPLTVASFAAMRALSRRNDDPAGASRPFDLKRDGFVMGEGAGVLVLENLESAQARGAEIYAEIIGYAATSDARNATTMRPDACQYDRTMRLALERAGIGPGEVDYVNAHGSSTPLNDVEETRALKRVLGRRAFQIPINATKSMTGHLLSAGAVELIATVLAIRDQRVHPTINLVNPDPECDLDYVPNGTRSHPVDVALKNSFGMGGFNTSLVFRRWN